jgi:hypothetical protein
MNQLFTNLTVQVLILRAFHINVHHVVLVKFEKAPGKYPGLLQ